MHAAQRKQKTLPPHEDRLLSGLLGPQPHGMFERSLPPTPSQRPHPEMPKKPLPLVDLNMRTAGLDLVHGLQLTAV